MRFEPTRAPDRDSPAAAHDEPYTFDRPPGTYLATREIVRLMILRSRLRERSVAGTSRD
jgi:hypothetical protein